MSVPSTPSPSETVRLRVRRPDDLLALLPYLLGFQPEESMVVALVRDGRVLLTARIDLAAEAALAAEVHDLLDQHAAEAVVLAAYCTDREVGERVLDGLLDALRAVPVFDALLVSGGRWWSLVCDSGCCPAEGTPYEPAAHPLAAEAVYAGLAPRASRAEVAAGVAGPGPGEWDRLREVARGLQGGVRRLGPAGREARMAREVVAGLDRVAPAGSAAPAGGGLDERDALRLALLAREVRVRDVACALVTRQEARRHLALWQQVVARVPPELASAPLCLLGVASWAAGDGTLLNCCCARLDALDPSCSMGRLLADVSARALSPSLWDALAAELRSDLGLLVG